MDFALCKKAFHVFISYVTAHTHTYCVSPSEKICFWEISSLLTNFFRCKYRFLQNKVQFNIFFVVAYGRESSRIKISQGTVAKSLLEPFSQISLSNFFIDTPRGRLTTFHFYVLFKINLLINFNRNANRFFRLPYRLQA